MRTNSPLTLVMITAFLVVMITASAADADLQFMSRPGTVAYTMACADDTEVVLDTVIVARVAGSYLYIRDPWSADTLPVYAVAQFDTRWPVEITGRTATVLGTRIVIASHIRQYANQVGNPVLVIPKLAEPWNWPNMVEVPLAPIPEGDLPLPGGSRQALQQTQTMSYSLPTGEITLTDVIVTAGRGDDFTANTFYVEDEFRASGWKVVFTGTPVAHRGNKVTVIGEAALDANQEAYIDASDVDVTSTGSVRPILMSNRHLGGNDSLEKPGVNTPLLDHLYNKGLLVTCVGKVTFVDAASDCFYIDDGSALDDGSGNIGVKVSWSLQAAGDLNPEIVPPLEDWYVTVTGISSSESPSEGTVIRALRPRRQEDIIVKVPEDITDPSVQITNPSGSQILKLPSANSVQLAGTAVDTETGVAYVQVKIDGGAWHMASYNSTTHAWTYTWNNPSSTRIWVHAMDFAGHLTEIYRDVTVSAPQVIYVSKNGNNSNNGWTWGTAKLTVQAALNTAWAEGETAVWVAQGTYTERLTINNHSIDLYGGFVGDETSRDQRPTFPRPDQDPHETMLDGYSGYTVIATGTGTSIVHGFTITHGNPYGVACGGSHLLTLDSDKITGNNGGIRFQFTYAPSPVASWVRRCDISDNDGTGIECSTKSAAVIEDNHIDHNVLVPSTFGAGVFCYNGSSPTIQRNWIEYNNLLGEGPGGNDGGGIWCNGGQPTIRNNVIKGNRARKGGAIFVTGISTVTMTNNTIVDNVASEYGGVVFIYQSYVTMANNVFYANNTGVYRSDTAGSLTLSSNCSLNLQQDYYGVYIDHSADHIGNPGLGSDRVHLAVGSYCIDRAYTYCVGPSDIDHDDRVLGVRGDIGADEYRP